MAVNRPLVLPITVFAEEPYIKHRQRMLVPTLRRDTEPPLALRAVNILLTG